jgi:hypothetical protein
MVPCAVITVSFPDIIPVWRDTNFSLRAAGKNEPPRHRDTEKKNYGKAEVAAR